MVLDRVTIMLAGYSNPYPWRPKKAPGDGVSRYLYKTEHVKSAMTRSKLTWLYSNVGINQTADIFERPNLTRLETYPFEYSQKEGRKTCDIQDTKLPDSCVSSKVSDAIVSSMLRKIWYDFHPSKGRWKKMTFKPTLYTVSETETRSPALDSCVVTPKVIQGGFQVKKDNATKLPPIMKSVLNVLRRIFRKKTKSQSMSNVWEKKERI